MAFEEVQTEFRKRLAAIKAKVPVGATNAQNRDAIVALIDLIDSMEVNRIQTLLEGRKL